MNDVGTFGRYLTGWREKAAAVLHTALPHQQGNRTLALALQGGGAHGAFTWGVLDALLKRRFAIDAISGTSAGAFNAVFLAHGWLEGGPEGARDALATLWRRVGAKAVFSPLQPSLMDQFTSGWNLDRNARHFGLDLFTRILSPYQFNPLDMNPLRDLLEDHIDFERLRRSRRIRLLIAATDVETGHPRLFGNRDISTEAVLASATLPWLHHAVRIGDHHYWDGGFTANPPLMPLVETSKSRDVLLIRLDSGQVGGPPVTARAIHARLNQIMFTAPLNHDLDQFTHLQQMAQEGALKGPLGRRLAAARLHVIEGGEDLQAFGQSSKLSPHRTFLQELYGLGHQRAEAWMGMPAAEGAELQAGPTGDAEPCPSR